MTENLGNPGHGRNAGRTKVPATALSIVGKSHYTDMSNGKGSVSEEPTVYSEDREVENQREMLSKKPEIHSSKPGKKTANPQRFKTKEGCSLRNLGRSV